MPKYIRVVYGKTIEGESLEEVEQKAKEIYKTQPVTIRDPFRSSSKRFSAPIRLVGQVDPSVFEPTSDEAVEEPKIYADAVPNLSEDESLDIASEVPATEKESSGSSDETVESNSELDHDTPIENEEPVSAQEAGEAVDETSEEESAEVRNTSKEKSEIDLIESLDSFNREQLLELAKELGIENASKFNSKTLRRRIGDRLNEDTSE